VRPNAGLDGVSSVTVATQAGVVSLAARLSEDGFRKRAGRIFTRTLPGDRIAWLGINIASHSRPKGETLLHPVVGIRDQLVERIVANGRGEKLHAYVPPTVSSPLRYLVPDRARPDWVLDGSSGDAQVVEAVASAVSRFGVPFVESLLDRDRLVSTLEDAHARDQQAAYRWPALLMLLGRRAEASAASSAVVAELGDRDDQAARELRAFIDWLTSNPPS
jgi:hypothetical protein